MTPARTNLLSCWILEDLPGECLSDNLYLYRHFSLVNRENWEDDFRFIDIAYILNIFQIHCSHKANALGSLFGA